MTNKPTQIRPFSGSDVRLLPHGQRPQGGMVAGASDYYPDADRRAIVPSGSTAVRRPALQGDILPPLDPQPARVPVQTLQTVATSHRDRAEGFNLVTIPLAFVAGLVALLVAVSLADVPLLSWSALLILFGAFAAVWGVAYAWHTLASPDGAVILGILLAYRFQRHEQRARLDRLAVWGSEDDEDL